MCGYGVEFSGIGDAVFSAEDGAKKLMKGLFLSEHISCEAGEVQIFMLFEISQYSAKLNN